jgi:hypothetical protein
MLIKALFVMKHQWKTPVADLTETPAKLEFRQNIVDRRAVPRLWLRVWWILLWSFTCAAAVHAQESNTYLFVAPGAVSGGSQIQRTYQLGGGMERLLNTHFGVGAELSSILPPDHIQKNTRGVFGLDAILPFTDERPFMPFATAGYAFLFHGLTANLVTYGGGIQYWYQENRGLRLEVRDQVWANGPTGALHYWGIRVGLTFR